MSPATLNSGGSGRVTDLSMDAIRHRRFVVSHFQKALGFINKFNLAIALYMAFFANFFL